MDEKIHPTMTRPYMFILPSFPYIIFVNVWENKVLYFWSSHSYAMKISNNRNTSWAYVIFARATQTRHWHDYFHCQSLPEIFVTSSIVTGNESLTFRPSSMSEPKT